MSDQRRVDRPGGIGRRGTDGIKLDALALATAETRRIHRLIGAGSIMLGVLAVLSAYGFFTSDTASRSAIHDQLPDLGETLWNAAWGLGGLVIVYGSMRPRPAIELAGHIIFCAALVPYSVAVLVKFGLGSPALFLALTVASFSVARQYFLWRYAGRVTILAVPPPPRPPG